MPDTHVVLIKCRTNTQLIELLPQCITDACAPNGGRLVSLYWTDGPYDAVAMIELDSRLLPVFKLVIEADHVSNVVVMRAFDQQETLEARGDWVLAEFGHMGPRFAAVEYQTSAPE
ncbi:MAG: hypothetical protein QOG94_2244 [Solirubrobacteraceae bacterium]|jgi:uncharacterized protein with GYD domain|nr:hypothetical protein [Solirubrobacteraceae bacterium]MEA2137834.1 hypothetical protein [Solirubrobacteraceae bacterium]